MWLQLVGCGWFSLLWGYFRKGLGGGGGGGGGGGLEGRKNLGLW